MDTTHELHADPEYCGTLVGGRTFFLKENFIVFIGYVHTYINVGLLVIKIIKIHYKQHCWGKKTTYCRLSHFGANYTEYK